MSVSKWASIWNFKHKIVRKYAWEYKIKLTLVCLETQIRKMNMINKQGKNTNIQHNYCIHLHLLYYEETVKNLLALLYRTKLFCIHKFNSTKNKKVLWKYVIKTIQLIENIKTYQKYWQQGGSFITNNTQKMTVSQRKNKIETKI